MDTSAIPRLLIFQLLAHPFPSQSRPRSLCSRSRDAHRTSSSQQPRNTYSSTKPNRRFPRDDDETPRFLPRDRTLLPLALRPLPLPGPARSFGHSEARTVLLNWHVQRLKRGVRTIAVMSLFVTSNQMIIVSMLLHLRERPLRVPRLIRNWKAKPSST